MGIEYLCLPTSTPVHALSPSRLLMRLGERTGALLDFSLRRRRERNGQVVEERLALFEFQIDARANPASEAFLMYIASRKMDLEDACAAVYRSDAVRPEIAILIAESARIGPLKIGEDMGSGVCGYCFATYENLRSMSFRQLFETDAARRAIAWRVRAVSTTMHDRILS